MAKVSLYVDDQTTVWQILSESAADDEDKMRDREADPQTIRATEAYQELIRRRRRLLLATGLPPFVLLMALTGFTVFTDLLDEQLVPGLNLAILLAYVVFFAPVVAAHVYIARVRVLDALAERALTEAYTPTGGRA